MRKFGLGRIAKTDLRDHAYALRPMRAPGITSRAWYNTGIWDQGQTPECVAFSSLKWLTAGPVSNKAAQSEADDFYQSCKKIDGLGGGDGTTVRAAFQILQERGYVNTYNWAFDVQTAANFILTTGPMVFGTEWANSMFDSDSRGFINLDLNSGIAGGHAYLVIGVDTRKACPDKTKGAFRIINSWGQAWGQNGRAWLPFSSAAILFKEDGEACCALEVKKPK